MANLSAPEKRRIEKLFKLGSGYVFSFSDRTFSEFVEDSIGRDAYNMRYDLEGRSRSKANRLRGIMDAESNFLVGKLLDDLFQHGMESGNFNADPPALIEDCRKTITRLNEDHPVPDMDALTPNTAERDFDVLAKEIQELIARNMPEAGLDRLHTFVIKYVRGLCDVHGIVHDREKPLQSLFGEYVKKLKEKGHVESEMTLRILKSSISVLDAFNFVRNNQSLAHDNTLLNYDESVLIFSHVSASIRFLKAFEARLQAEAKAKAAAAEKSTFADLNDEIQF